MRIPDGFLSVEDVAKHLSLSRFTIHVMAKTGEIQAQNMNAGPNVAGRRDDRFVIPADEVERQKSDPKSAANQKLWRAKQMLVAAIENNPRNKKARIDALHRFILETELVQRDAFGLIFSDKSRCKTGTALCRRLADIAFVHPDDCLAWLRSDMPRDLRSPYAKSI